MKKEKCCKQSLLEYKKKLIMKIEKIKNEWSIVPTINEHGIGFQSGFNASLKEVLKLINKK